MKFQVGQRVYKVGGDYTLTGTVMAAFLKKSGHERYVVEADLPSGLLHIYGPSNLEVLNEPTPPL